MLALPINPPSSNGQAREPQLLGSLVQVKSSSQQANVSHYNIAPVIDIYVSVDGRDLASTYADIEQLIEQARTQLPRGSEITVRGQIETLHTAFNALGAGLLMAVVLVYLLLVVNFHSWLDPAIILMALPGALSGMVWLLFATGTTISVPALMGAIMSIGVATANSILLVTFANDQRPHGLSALEAALAAGRTRLRPVVMTALAMIIGMLPMSLSLGEGGEQNAPLARAVIGGLLLATLATLFVVPIIYSLVRTTPPAPEQPELA